MINFIEITSVEFNYNTTDVFDIEVEYAHQYIANNFVVHNCTTSVNGGHHFGMASLIIDLAERKHKVESIIRQQANLRSDCIYKSIPFIVADGGFNAEGKIIKALALGADYCMLGEVFAKSQEACGDVVYKEVPALLSKVDNENNVIYYDGTKLVPHRVYYGMSTKRAQKESGRKNTRTSEGIEKLVSIDYSLSTWCENFIDNLRSSMSYSDSKTLHAFKTSKYTIISYL